MEIKEIIKSSLNKFHGKKYDNIISSLELIKEQNSDKITYHQMDRFSQHSFASIKDGILYINTNMLQIRHFRLEDGKDWDYIKDHIIDPPKWNGEKYVREFEYEDNISIILKDIRNDKISSILV